MIANDKTVLINGIISRLKHFKKRQGDRGDWQVIRKLVDELDPRPDESVLAEAALAVAPAQEPSGFRPGEKYLLDGTNNMEPLTVTYIRDGTKNTAWVQSDDKALFNVERSRLVPEKAPEPKFKPGDRVHYMLALGDTSEPPYTARVLDVTPYVYSDGFRVLIEFEGGLYDRPMDTSAQTWVPERKLSLIPAPTEYIPGRGIPMSDLTASTVKISAAASEPSKVEDESAYWFGYKNSVGVIVLDATKSSEEARQRYGAGAIRARKDAIELLPGPVFSWDDHSSSAFTAQRREDGRWELKTDSIGGRRSPVFLPADEAEKLARIILGDRP